MRNLSHIGQSALMGCYVLAVSSLAVIDSSSRTAAAHSVDASLGTGVAVNTDLDDPSVDPKDSSCIFYPKDRNSFLGQVTVATQDTIYTMSLPGSTEVGFTVGGGDIVIDNSEDESSEASITLRWDAGKKILSPAPVPGMNSDSAQVKEFTRVVGQAFPPQEMRHLLHRCLKVQGKDL